MHKDLTKANLGCGPLPLYPQDAQFMGNPDEWILVDKYIEQEGIENWDIEDLPLDDNSLTEIYTSHALEHISHMKVPQVLKHWYDKLKKKGRITNNVPDLTYACKQLMRWENNQFLEGHYDQYFGLNGVLSIIYGTHSQPGEYHMSGFTPKSLTQALEEAGFKDVVTTQMYDDHQMGVVIATAWKK